MTKVNALIELICSDADLSKFRTLAYINAIERVICYIELFEIRTVAAVDSKKAVVLKVD